MSNTSIQLKKSGQTGNTPSNLAFGEIAINYADGKLYYKDDTGSIDFISNQFSFDTINANNSLILATGVSDTLSFVAGNNITIDTNTTTKTITINSTGTATDQPARDTANAAFLQSNAAFSKANSVLSGFAANTLIVANSTGHLSNSNAEFSLSNNTLYVPNANISNEVIANSLVFYDGTRLNSATGISANTAATANVTVYARVTNVTTGTYFPIVTDTTITGSDTLHYSSNDFVMYAANNTFRATGNVWAGQFLTVGSNVPVVNSTGHWVGQTISAGSAGSANTANVAINARITNVTTGTYFPIVTDTTITGSDTLHYSSNDFLMYASNNTFRATGNLWAGTSLTVGTNIPVVNSTGHWVGQTINAIDSFARSTANSAGLYANGAFIAANTADSKAVTSGSYANAAFAHANAAFNVANTAGGGGTGNAAFIFSGTSNVYFATANGNIVANVGGNTIATVTNTGIQIAGGNLTGANNIYANTFIANETITISGSGGDISGANNITGNNIIATNGVVIAGLNVVPHLQSAFLAANTPSHVANSAALYANGAFIQANAAYGSQNTTGIYANSAYAQANIATNNAAGASLYANAAFAHANAAFNVANTGGGGGSGNASFIFSGTSNVYFATANGNIVANVGGNTIATVTNTGIQIAGGNLDGANNIYANTFIANNTITISGSGGDISGANNITGNNIIAVNGVTVAGLNVVPHLLSAFTAANTPSHVANSAALYANGAFIQANAAFNKANTGAANTANTANVATVAINARITIVNTGIYYPIVTDTTITGNDTLHYSSSDFLMYAANNTFRAAGNVWAGEFIAVGTNIPVINSTGHWVGQTVNGVDSLARTNAASAGSYANSAFIAANTADSKAVTAGSYANSAFSVANTDVTNINITGGVYGNSSSIPVITLAANGRIIAVSNATVSGGGGSGEDQYARDTANAAFIQANAAFNTANTGGGSGSDQYARDTANAAFDQANAAFNAANTTTSNNGATLSGTITPLANTSDQFNIIGITGDITIAAPAGTPTEGQKLIIRLKDAGTSVNISWNVVYRSIGFTLPTTTVANKTAYIGFIYNTADADWDGVAISLES